MKSLKKHPVNLNNASEKKDWVKDLSKGSHCEKFRASESHFRKFGARIKDLWGKVKDLNAKRC